MVTRQGWGGFRPSNTVRETKAAWHARATPLCHYGRTPGPSNQFTNGRPFHQVLGPAGRVVDGRGGRVDAEVVVQRREDLLEVDRPLPGVLAEPVGGADGLAGLH